jgi:hypothetical protein
VKFVFSLLTLRNETAAQWIASFFASTSLLRTLTGARKILCSRTNRVAIFYGQCRVEHGPVLPFGASFADQLTLIFALQREHHTMAETLFKEPLSQRSSPSERGDATSPRSTVNNEVFPSSPYPRSNAVAQNSLGPSDVENMTREEPLARRSSGFGLSFQACTSCRYQQQFG